MLAVNAGKNHDDFRVILETLDEVLVKRRRNMSQQRLMAFVKRLLTISLNLLHHGTLASLGTIKTTFQLTSVLDILLDTDDSIGSGKYDAELEDRSEALGGFGETICCGHCPRRGNQKNQS